MTKQEIKSRYFSWILNKIKAPKIKTYSNLLHYLFARPFDYILDMDGNRAEDGIELRYSFGYEEGIDQRIIATYLDDSPCSILEMMVALSMRCENDIMSDDTYGDRTACWFWNMIKSLGLYNMDDHHFSMEKVINIIDTFLNREYHPNGKGGLFTLKSDVDIRMVEIWYQMMNYLNERMA